VAKSKPPPARKAPDPDPEISAFVKRRRNRAFVFVTVILVLGVLGVAYYEFGDSGPSPAAKHAYEEGRKAYLLDTEKQLVLAEKELKKAAGKEPGSYPDANGALAELYMVWAEHYRDAYDLLSAEVKTKAESGNTDEAKKLNDKAKAVSAEVKKKLDAAQEQLNALKAIETSSLAADRAALDYARLVNDAKQANAAVETLKPQTDPETQAHVAAWLATDPAQRGTAETSLTDAIQNEPNFIRARWWLASLHIALGNTAAATSDLQALLKLAPGHEEAAEALKKLQQAAQPVTAVASDNGSNGTPAPATPETKPKEAASEKGSTAESGTATPEKKDRHAKEPRKGSDESASSSAPMDPDKLIDQAGHLLDKGKPAAALEVYDRVLAVKPTLTDALYGKGVALYNMGRTTDAITAFLKTLEVNARFSDAIIGVAEAYKKNHDNKSAVKYYEKYLDVFPGGPQAGAARANIRALSSP
jgi:tetratricopeptide (TPR) repeat protein